MGTPIEGMGFNMIGIVSPLQRMARVPLLSAGLPARLLPQTAGPGLLQTITAGRLTSITAVLGQLVLQGLNGSCLLLDQGFYLLQPSQQNLN